MRRENRNRNWSWIVLAAAGIAGMVFFQISAAALLLEDLRFLVIPASQLEIVEPPLELWLAQVFIVSGGYAVATGVLPIAAISERRDPKKACSVIASPLPLARH